jgi:hypothetical protein
MTSLNETAWNRWVAYKIAIKDAYKPVSLEAAKLKLERFGADQEAVVDQSIANGWKGLFALQKSKDKPDATKRTKEQQAAVDSNFEWQKRESEKGWNKDIARNPLHAKLLLCDALQARYDAQADQESLVLAEQRSWLRGRVGQLLAECHDKAALTDFTVRRLVLQLFGGGGLDRLEKRAREVA